MPAGKLNNRTWPCVPSGNQVPGHAQRQGVSYKRQKIISKTFYQAGKNLRLIY